MLMALGFCALGAVYYQWEKRNIERHNAAKAARAAELHAAE